MIKRIVVTFTKDVHLPRFTMKNGDTWEVRVDRIEENGFTLGSGYVNNEYFKVTGWK